MIRTGGAADDPRRYLLRGESLKGVNRIFEQSASGMYLLDGIDITSGFQKREAGAR